MGTKRPIASISFNTSQFLEMILKENINKGVISSYAYIKHHAEEDTKKEHYHMLVVPAKVLDPVCFRKQFFEPCLDGDLCSLPFLPSKLNDWLLYSLHFPPYLIKKGLTRCYHYTLDDVITNEPREWLEDIFYNGQEELTNKRISQFIDRVYQGDTFGDILSSGLVPENQIIFYDKLYSQLNYRREKRIKQYEQTELTTKM